MYAIYAYIDPQNHIYGIHGVSGHDMMLENDILMLWRVQKSLGGVRKSF